MTVPESIQYLINKYPGGGAPGFHLGVVRESLGSVFWVMEHGDTYADFSVFGTLPVVDSQWHHLVYVRNSVTGLRELWVDGKLETSDTETHPVDNIDTTHRMIIGGRYTNPTGAWTNGVLDEIRFSRTVRSADWIITSYNNQNDPEGYLKLWPQESVTGIIEVNATVDGAAWSGSIRYTLTGPENIYGDSVPVTLESLTGTYTLAYISGGPANAILTDISPSDTQTLDAIGTISFTLNFLAPPSAPLYLTATATSTNSIDLSWRDYADNEERFSLERKTGFGTYTEIAVFGPDTTTYSDTGLAPATTYYYRIMAANAAGGSAYSNEAVAMTFRLPPFTPSFLTATAIFTSSIDLSWTDNGNEVSFTLERKTGNFGTYTEIAVFGPDTTTYSDTGLAPATTYYYRIIAANTAGGVIYSNEVGATTMPAVAPTATTDPATDINGNSAVLNATVNPNGSETTVYFQWGTSPSYGNTTSAQSAGRDTNDVAISAKITGLSLNTTYYYRVVASNSAGTIPGSGRSFTTPPITLTITSPSDGETIYGPDIMVTGTVINATGNETGVSVNGMLANMDGSEFFVNHVPLEEGANTITATATDTDGNTASTSIVVQAEAADYVTLKANTESGIDPLTTYFSVTTSIPNAVTSYEMDYEGDGTVDYTGAAFDGISFTYRKVSTTRQ